MTLTTKCGDVSTDYDHHAERNKVYADWDEFSQIKTYVVRVAT